ncbi:MAG: hypothetical protein ACK5NG_00180 [Chthoniobacterales bacterium]
MATIFIERKKLLLRLLRYYFLMLAAFSQRERTNKAAILEVSSKTPEGSGTVAT